MAWRTLAATDSELAFSNVARVHRNVSGLAVFDRCFPAEACRALGPGMSGMQQTPGASVSVLTNAVGIRAELSYSDCRTGCAGVYPVCYTPRRQCFDRHMTSCTAKRSEAFCVAHKLTKCGGICRNHCQPTLYVDGVRRELPAPSVRDRYDGLLTLELLASNQQPNSDHRQITSNRQPNSNQPPAANEQPLERRPIERRVDLVMPPGGEVRFASLQLLAEPGTGPLTVRRATVPRFTYIAYGDSVTAGSCADTFYPEVIGRLNGWNVLNLGFNGLTISPSHGAALGAIAAPSDLISVLIGTNDQHSCDISEPFGRFLDGLRSRNPSANVVVLTQLIRNDEGTNATWRNGRCVTVEEHRQHPNRNRNPNPDPSRNPDLNPDPGSNPNPNPNPDPNPDPGSNPNPNPNPDPNPVPIPNPNRQQLRAVVRSRQATDARLHIVEGKPLLSLDQLVDGLHPRDRAAMHQLALRLNGAFHRLRLADRFVCYAQRHPDLRRAYCNVSKPNHRVQPTDLAQCDYPALMTHWEGAGRQEGRKLDCVTPATSTGVGRSRSMDVDLVSR